MKAVKITLAGRERYLASTVETMFAIQEIFGGSGELVEAIRDTGRAGFSAACKAAEILSQQGELVRRGLRYDPQPMTDTETIAATMAPSETAALKLAVPSALSLGYGREIEPENGEIDLGLAELDAQKNAVTRSHYIRMRTLAGLSKNETLLSTPGEIGDLWELYLQAGHLNFSKFFPTSAGLPQYGQQIERVPVIFWIPAAIRAKARKRAIILGITKIKKPKNKTGKRTIPPTIIPIPAG